jgi:hypothetical protein
MEGDTQVVVPSIHDCIGKIEIRSSELLGRQGSGEGGERAARRDSSTGSIYTVTCIAVSASGKTGRKGRSSPILADRARRRGRSSNSSQTAAAADEVAFRTGTVERERIDTGRDLSHIATSVTLDDRKEGKEGEERCRRTGTGH